MHCRRQSDVSLLLIEDSEPELELMAYLLAAGGYCVMSARNGEVGLELAGREKPDLVVCDVFLPGMDGYAVAKQLKAHPTLRHIPLLAVTTLDHYRSREKLRAAGFDGYIGKPIEPRSFVGQVESFLPPKGSALRARGAQPARGRRRILVVDDVPQDTERLKAGLEAGGHEIALAPDAAHAAELLARENFDLIISDIHLPEQDGFSFLSSVKANAAQREIPFLFLSASTWSEQNRRLVLNQPQTRCLRLPVAPARLLAEVESSLNAGRQG